MITAYDDNNDGFCIPFNRSGLKFIGISSSGKKKKRKNRFNLSIHSRVNTSTFLLFILQVTALQCRKKNVYDEIDDGFQEAS